MYLDVARLLNRPFGWAHLAQVAAQQMREPLPHPRSHMYDSLRALAISTSGRLVDNEALEVWTSDHIDDTVEYIAAQPTRPPAGGARGLGWTPEEADELVEHLVHRVVTESGGGSVGSIPHPDGNPPLDHEDGLVLGACRELVTIDLLANVYCVTGDGGFLRAASEGRLPDHSKVMSPAKFVAMVRRTRQLAATQAMARRPAP